MESIKIENFLTISNAYFEIKKINILIGSQASGKSVIAKLVYFFKNFFAKILIESAEKQGTKADVAKQCLKKFEQIFPRYTWGQQAFSIVYRFDTYIIKISRTKPGNEFLLDFDYCPELQTLYETLKAACKHAEYNSMFASGRGQIMSLMPAQFENAFKYSVFIAAARSFFAIFQNNLLSFLANDTTDIDPFMTEFGLQYAFAKRGSALYDVSDSDKTIQQKLDKLSKLILSGDYIFSEGKDWISSDGNNTNLAHASSGQQESLPMLLMLSTWLFWFGRDKRAMYFIEEPEAHLFPTSQKQIVSLLATIYHEFNHAFFITTHSPYILTALNNLVVAQDAYEKVGENSAEGQKLAEFIPFDEVIKFEDVSAYTLDSGQLHVITDPETRLIGANIIDAVSESFDEAFDVASTILYG